MSLRVELKVVGPDARTLRDEVFEVDADHPLTFGRSDKNLLQVPDTKKMVSNQHGRIERRGDGYVVVDSSTNGTLVDGARLDRDAEVSLRNGGAIALGDFVIEVSWPQLDRTMVHATPAASDDPDAVAAVLWDELCGAHAARRAMPAAERAAQLEALLQQRLQELSLPPAHARAVLKRVLGHSGGAAAAPTPGEIAAPGEDLLQSSLNELRRLARSLVGDRALESPRDVVSFVEQIEVYLQQTLQWLVTSLRGRAEFEDQFGAEVTMVFQRSNNPLKGLAAQDLGASLFDWSGQGGGQQAHLEGILRDLTQHQLGLLGGVKEAIAAVTERLAPDAIEAVAQKDASWLTSKAAKAWEVYQQIYGDLMSEKGRLFHEVISPGIRKGYLTVHDQQPGRTGAPDDEDDSADTQRS